MKQLLASIISSICPGIRGKRTHLHALIAMAIYAFLMVVAILEGEVLVALIFFALINHAASLGCARWTLKAVEKKIDALMEKAGAQIYRD